MSGRTYGQLTIKSDYRVHDVVFDMIQGSLSAGATLRVLDIATGTGAFARRLADNFPRWKIEVNDFERQSQLSDLRTHHTDLNADFAKSFDASYDLIVALEVMEHLENPWHFLRQTRVLLRDGGILIVSTPNGDSTLDRLTYLIEGHPFYFGERGYQNSDGHITHVPDWLFRKIALSTGYTSISLNDAVDMAPFVGVRTVLKFFVLMPFAGLYMRRKNDRSVNIYRCS